VTTKADRESGDVDARDVILVFARNQLERLNKRQVLAALRYMNALSKRGKPGAPPEYPSQYAQDVLDRIRHEMARLKAAGKRQCGAKTAIRSIIRRRIIEVEGEAALARRVDKIDALTAKLFKVYEAARRRRQKHG